MANSSSNAKKILGLALVVIGIGLAIWGYRLSGSIGSEITQAVTGSDTKEVMNFYIGGAVSFVVGLFLFIK
jgi:phosphate/sulfate permease